MVQEGKNLAVFRAPQLEGTVFSGYGRHNLRGVEDPGDLSGGCVCPDSMITEDGTCAVFIGQGLVSGDAKLNECACNSSYEFLRDM